MVLVVGGMVFGFMGWLLLVVGGWEGPPDECRAAMVDGTAVQDC
jgi:hypothetical protein